MKDQVTVLTIVSIVTLLIRALPFLFQGKRDNRFLEKFSEILTPALIGMLVVYCLKDVTFSDSSALASLASVALCVLSYVYKRNTLLSIILPTVFYMVLVNF